MTAGADKRVVVDGVSEDPAIMKLCNDAAQSARNVIMSLISTVSNNVQLSTPEAGVGDETYGGMAESFKAEESNEAVITAMVE